MNNESEIVMTPIKYSVHRKGVNPIFGEGIVQVELDDDGAGLYIKLSQNQYYGDADNSIRIDEEEIDVIAATAKKLLDGSRSPK